MQQVNCGREICCNTPKEFARLVGAKLYVPCGTLYAAVAALYVEIPQKISTDFSGTPMQRYMFAIANVIYCFAMLYILALLGGYG